MDHFVPRKYIFNKNRDMVKAVLRVMCYDCTCDLNFKFTARVRESSDASMQTIMYANRDENVSRKLIYLQSNKIIVSLLIFFFSLFIFFFNEKIHLHLSSFFSYFPKNSKERKFKINFSIQNCNFVKSF